MLSTLLKKDFETEHEECSLCHKAQVGGGPGPHNTPDLMNDFPQEAELLRGGRRESIAVFLRTERFFKVA